MKNQFVAEVLYKIADLLDLKGEIFFKTRAYRMAAQKIEVMEEDIVTVVKEQRLEIIPGIGEALAKKITELVETGKLDYFERLKKEIPEGLIDLLGIPGLGPKKVAALYQRLGITTMSELRDACLKGKLRDLEGFGEVTEQNLLRGIQLREKTSGRALLNVAYADGYSYYEYLKHCDKIDQISLAGSLRRMKETIGDVDILASSDYPDEVMAYFVKYEDVQEVLLQGSTKTSVLLQDNLQVDLRVVPKESYGAALQYFTGSKEHNVAMRSLAIKNGFKLNEYGLFDKESEKNRGGRTEEEIYTLLGLQYIPPELRENRGEITVAQNKKLPKLVDYDMIQGDFHVHSNWSDGRDSIETIALYAKRLRYSFVGITDHSQGLKIANGLSEERVKKKIKEIQQLNKKIKGIQILCGTECDIKPNGSLDYPDRVLEMFDFVYIGIHSSFKMSKMDMTRRIVQGMQNEYVDILAHPTGRIIGRRDPYEVDIEKILETAQENNVFLEINSFPDRLDLNDVHCKLAKDRGLQCVLGTDAHNIAHLPFMRFGVSTARRGWLEPQDVLNTSSLKKIHKILGDAR